MNHEAAERWQRVHEFEFDWHNAVYAAVEAEADGSPNPELEARARKSWNDYSTILRNVQRAEGREHP